MGNDPHTRSADRRGARRESGMQRGNAKRGAAGHSRGMHARPRIAYLSSSPGGVYHFEKWLMWRGIAEAAKENGIDLVYLAGESFEHSPQAVLYDLAEKHDLDGLIVWNLFVSQSSSLEKTQEFVDWFHPLPVISIDLRLSGCANLLTDDALGVRDLLLHLIRGHGYRKIAFVGQKDNHFSSLRQDAFQKVMSQFDLFRPEMVYTLDDVLQSPQACLKDCEAIVAFSDDMAVQIIEVLREQGLRIPEDMVVTGFNDGEEARGAQPPLTTVRQPYRSLGRKAVELLAARIQGERVPQDTVLTPQLILRRSCGCLEPMAEQAAAGPVVRSTGSLWEALSTAHTVLPGRMSASMGTSIENLAYAWSERLLEVVIAEINRYREDPDRHTTPSRQYLHDLSELLREAVAESSNVTRWHEALTLLRQYLLPYLKGSDLAFTEDMWQQARVLIGQVAVRAEVHRGWQAARRTEILREIESDLLITVDLNELLDILAGGLPRLRVRDFFLVLYENETFNPEGSARLALAFQAGRRVPVDPEEQSFPVREILPQKWLQEYSPFSIVVEALHLRSEQIGYIVFQADPPLDASECDIFQALRIQFSSALKGVRLRHKLHDARQQAEEANQLKSRFLSMVSHELRTPLNLIVGLSEMAIRQQARSGHDHPPAGEGGRDHEEGVKRFLEQIYVSGQHLDRLIRDVLDLASSQLGEMSLMKKPLDLLPVVQDVAGMGEHLAQQKNLRFRMEVPDHLPRVLGDKTRLRQILLNLLSNAIKFTAHGEVVLTARAEDHEIVISVRDTGLGIAREDQDKIFDEFRQSDRSILRGYGGIGLGLAITRRLVELHDGRIWVTSSGEEGGGSNFQFTLPILVEAPNDLSPENREEDASRDGVVVILTGAPGESQELMQYLNGHGFQVEELALQETPDVIENLLQAPPGAVVLDLAPASEQGWDIMKQVKENPATQDIPVLFYSLIREENSGVVLEMDYLNKPVGIENLVKALHRHGLVKTQPGVRHTILIVDDEPGILDIHSRLVRAELPDVNVLTARNGLEGLQVMRSVVPDLVLLDLMMPELDGFGVLKAMQADPALRNVPVIILSAQVITRREMDRLNQGVATVLSKGMFDSAEILSRIADVLARNKRLGSESQKLVQQAIGYIHEHYKEPISRSDIASAMCINEQYLSRCFNKEMGIGPMVYLSRYRIQRAKRLLEMGSLSITQIAMEVGMSSQSYFSRVFQEETGVTPSAYQRGARIENV